MLRKILIINLLLALVWQPVALAFATNELASEMQGVEFSNSSSMIVCGDMDMSDCEDRDNCSLSGHVNCEAKSSALLTVPGSDFQKNSSFPIAIDSLVYLSQQFQVPFRPPRHI